ncbi:gamma carbonic anhydrase family protein [Ralstonia insidiosa]|uniref:gamma carbonic anhydrase family protein n=1 Tax=Ralstonia TaxID=48736 RepID=UPI000385A0AB|nr:MULTISPECIES: gamma carbonic anhydrase family protein [Ralstonia]EPX97672.1 hypothetical protein C404_11515 [Ralstonia sp. AU12-08]MBY4703931.1 gamma carbonic anhydrase family protein [Ralstonia insidiosa]
MEVLPEFLSVEPRVDEAAFIAPGAWVIGDVDIAEGASVWFGAVVRGDVQQIVIGPRSNLQDGVIVHVSTNGRPTVIGAEVSVGHGAILHSCTIEDGALVGFGARVLDGARVSRGAMLAAGAVLTPGKVVPAGQLWAGNPAAPLRDLREDEIANLRTTALRYVALAEAYRSGRARIYQAD